MKKNRIVTRVKDKTGISKTRNRNDDLTALQQRYQDFSKKLKHLILAIQTNLNAMVQLNRSRNDVVQAIASFTNDTPLFKYAGEVPPDGSESTSSFAAIHQLLYKKSKFYLDKYPEHILNYAIEWERVITNRINTHIKQFEKLRLDLNHYQSKVEDLNKDANKVLSKGKSVADKGIDKLKRNESKYVQARQDYDRFVNELCGFMEEVLDRGWKDLHPLLVKMTQFDVTFSNEEATILRNMGGVTKELIALGSSNDLKSIGRLKELETSSLESLINTYHPSGTTLAIMGGETGVGIGTLSSSQADELNIGGGGLFSSVRRSSSENFGSSLGGSHDTSRSRTNTGDSFGDWSNTGKPNLAAVNSSTVDISTSSMLSIAQSAAPPPTLDDIFGKPPGSRNLGMNEHCLSNSYPLEMPPLPPTLPPPPPPLHSQVTNFAGLSMYDDLRNNPSSMVASPIAAGRFNHVPSEVPGGIYAPVNSMSFRNISTAENANDFHHVYNVRTTDGRSSTVNRQPGFGSPTNPFE